MKKLSILIFIALLLPNCGSGENPPPEEIKETETEEERIENHPLGDVSSKSSIELKKLLEDGADPNIKNEKGFTPLMQLTGCFFIESTVDQSGSVIITIVEDEDLFEDTEEKIIILLEHGADPTITDMHSRNIIDYAIKHDHLDLLELILKHARNLDLNDEDSFYIWGAVCKDNPASIKMLIDYGLDIRSALVGDVPIAIFAAMVGASNTLKILLEMGIDVHTTDEKGEPLIVLTVECNQELTTNLLLKHGANPNAINHEGQSLLHIAVLHDAYMLAQILENRGASIDTRNRDGLAPIDLAKSDKMKKWLRRRMERPEER